MQAAFFLGVMLLFRRDPRPSRPRVALTFRTSVVLQLQSCVPSCVLVSLLALWGPLVVCFFFSFVAATSRLGTGACNMATSGLVCKSVPSLCSFRSLCLAFRGKLPCALLAYLGFLLKRPP